MSKTTLKPMPPLASDEEAEAFVATADLAEDDFSGFKPGNATVENTPINKHNIKSDT